MPQLDNRNHVAVSIRDKFKTLMLSSNFCKLVFSQQTELERISEMNRIDRSGRHILFIEQLYQYYIVEGKPKTYIHA